MQFDLELHVPFEVQRHRLGGGAGVQGLVFGAHGLGFGV